MWMTILLMLPLAGLAYVSWHVWALLPLAGAWKAAVIGIGVCCFLMLFLDLNGTLDKLPLPLSRILYEIGTSSILVLFYLAMLFLVLDAGRLVHIVPRSWLYDNWVTAAAVTGLMLTVFVCGNIHYKDKVRVALEIRPEKPLAKDYTIVFCSDLHLGYHNTRRDLSHWVDLINAEHPDLVLIAGDIIDISIRPLLEEDMAAEFRRLQAPVYACLGNHEYYSGSSSAAGFYRDAGITLLRDSFVTIDNTLALIGRDDRSNRRRRSLEELTVGVREAEERPYTILLDHQPHTLKEAEDSGIDLQLSGHTHRGQIWPVSWITDALYECSWGLHQRGATKYYVSSGLGIWGGKFRIGTQSEYVVLKLSRKG